MQVGRLHALVSELEEESSRWRTAASDEAAAGLAVQEELEAANKQAINGSFTFLDMSFLEFYP